MNRFCSGVFLIILALGSSASAQSSYTFSRIQVPDVIYTLATSINNRGTIVGSYSRGDGQQHAFIARDGQFSDFAVSVAGATNTSIAALNNREDLVGTYTEGAGVSHVYVSRRDGSLSTLDASALGATSVSPSAINDRGDIVGTYADADFIIHGFLYTRGSFRRFDVTLPGAQNTFPTGINSRGTIVGTYYTSDGMLHGFVRTNGRDTSFDEPGSPGAVPVGVSNSGLIVGYATAAGQNTPMPVQHAFVANRGVFSDLVPVFPNEPPSPILFSRGLAINDHGSVLGQSTPTKGAITISFLAEPIDCD